MRLLDKEKNKQITASFFRLPIKTTAFGFLAVILLFFSLTGHAHAAGCPNEVLRGSQPSGLLLGDCRGYEQVSPAGEGKSGNDAEGFPGVVGASPSGDGVHYFSSAPFAGSGGLSGDATEQYLSSRAGPGEWLTESVEPEAASEGAVIGFDPGL